MNPLDDLDLDLLDMEGTDCVHAGIARAAAAEIRALRKRMKDMEEPALSIQIGPMHAPDPGTVRLVPVCATPACVHLARGLLDLLDTADARLVLVSEHGILLGLPFGTTGGATDAQERGVKFGTALAKHTDSKCPTCCWLGDALARLMAVGGKGKEPEA